jgi:hypothetical protein
MCKLAGSRIRAPDFGQQGREGLARQGHRLVPAFTGRDEKAAPGGGQKGEVKLSIRSTFAARACSALPRLCGGGSTRLPDRA